MLLSVSAFGEPHPLQQQLQRQLNEAKATQEAVRHAGDGDGAAPRCDAGIKRVPRGTHWRRIDERPNPQAPRYFVLGILAIDLHCLDLLRLNISLGIQIKMHLSSFARAL